MILLFSVASFILDHSRLDRLQHDERKDFIDVWQTPTYVRGNSGGFQPNLPPKLLTIRQDGTYEFAETSNHWHYIDHELVLDQFSSGKDLHLKLTGSGSGLSDHQPQGWYFSRRITVQLEEGQQGLWSTDENPKAGAPDAKTFTIFKKNTFRRNGKVGVIQINRDHYELGLQEGKTVSLWPSKDFNQLKEKVPNGLNLYRLPEKPLNLSVLGKWHCTIIRGQSPQGIMTFFPNGAFTFESERGKWRIEQECLVLEKFQGSQVTFHSPALADHGMMMYTSIQERNGEMISGAVYLLRQ